MKLKIAVDGKTYEVDVEVAEEDRAALGMGAYMPMPSAVRLPAQAPAPAPAAALDSRAAVENEAKVCRSPISGVAVRVHAQVGQRIEVGDPLVVLEAMKMETNITAPVDAKIAKVNVGVGDSVQAGQVLVEFE